ncbi:hypothetical protein AQI70_36230 [Streptomyces curacoi]|uniref:Uncharacterized protein n=1 Tax=Streptomyces curacoi TaxID=146536 RepID=A0A117NU01_9ACTN|nr:hypothetical protein AQI70_36230 [Streptomyces curacoi]
MQAGDIGLQLAYLLVQRLDGRQQDAVGIDQRDAAAVGSEAEGRLPVPRRCRLATWSARSGVTVRMSRLRKQARMARDEDMAKAR